jgi:twitching motility protein PilT
MLSESLEGVVAQTLIATADGKSRVAALEILVGIPALRNLIREDKTAQILSIMQVGAQHGMQTLDQALKDLVTSGKISRVEALKRTTNPRLFEGASPAGPLQTARAAHS